MSTLRANTLSNSAGTGSPAITGGELSRARFNLNGTGTIAERGSFNIASYVDNGAGDYTGNFSTAFPNANYTFSNTTGGGGQQLVPRFLTGGGSSQTTSAIRCNMGIIADFVGGSTSTDGTHFQMALFGDRP